MKAIILTITGGQNFGNRLQNFALQEELKKQGLKEMCIRDRVKGHMSTLLYRRISLMSDEVIECTFNLACQMLENIRPEHYKAKGRTIDKDIERAFETRNYKLWKLASFIV